MPNGQHRTIADLCGNDRKKIDAVRKQWARTFGTPFRKAHVPTSEEVAVLFPSAKQETSKLQVKEKAVAKPKVERKPIDATRVSNIAFSIVCALIVLAHAALIWYDCGILWKVPGNYAGGIVFLFIAGALIEMIGGQKDSQSDNLLWFVWLLEVAAIFVHVPSFTENAFTAYARGAGEIYIWFLAATICVCSAAAMYFFREKMAKK